MSHDNYAAKFRGATSNRELRLVFK